MKARPHFALRHDKDARNADRLLHDERGDALDHLLHVPPVSRGRQPSLGLARDLRLDIGPEQARDGGSALGLGFQTAHQLIGDPCGFALRGRKDARFLRESRTCAVSGLRVEPELCRKPRTRDMNAHLPVVGLAGKHDLPQADRRIRPPRLVHDLLEAVMRHDAEPVHGLDAGAPAIGQAETAPDRLLDQDAGAG